MVRSSSRHRPLSVTESAARFRLIEGSAMPEYRAYMVGHDGHFVDAAHLICADDAEAIEKAKQLVDGHDVELWRLDRKIATFEHHRK
jgi:hypothetical protein